METVSKRQESLNHNGDSRAENGMVSRERFKKQIKKLVAVVMAHEKVGERICSWLGLGFSMNSAAWHP